MSNSPRYEPSMESLKLAVELARINGGTRAAFDVAQDAALFDAYLFGDLIVALRINDGASNLPNFKRAPHCFNRGIEILKRLVSFQPSRLCPASFYKNIKQSQNHVFVRRSHSSSPSSASKDACTDSHSKVSNESVAQDTQTERPAYATLRSLDGESHQALKMDTQPDETSQQTNSSALKDEYQVSSLAETSSAQKNAMAYRLLGDDHSQQGPLRSNPHKSCSPSRLQVGFFRPNQQEQNHTYSSPNDTRQASSDSTSEVGNDSVAQLTFELSVEELLQIIQAPTSPALRTRALNELKRRCGESVEEPS